MRQQLLGTNRGSNLGTEPFQPISAIAMIKFDTNWLVAPLLIPILLFLFAIGAFALLSALSLAGLAASTFGLAIARPFLGFYHLLGAIIFRGITEEADPDISQVSGLYGPGAYGAWLLTIASATINVILESRTPSANPPTFSTHFILSTLYLAVSSIRFYRRALAISFATHLLAKDATCQAAMHVCYVAIPFFAVCIVNSKQASRYVWMAAYIGVGAWALPLIWGDKEYITLDYRELAFQGLFTAWHFIAVYVLDLIETSHQQFKSLFTPGFIIIHYILLEVGGRRPLSLSPRSLTPSTESKLFDLDQLACLLITIITLAYQWKIWRHDNPVARLWNRKAQKEILHIRGNPVELEKGVLTHELEPSSLLALHTPEWERARKVQK